MEYIVQFNNYFIFWGKGRGGVITSFVIRKKNIKISGDLQVPGAFKTGPGTQFEG